MRFCFSGAASEPDELICGELDDELDRCERAATPRDRFLQALEAETLRRAGISTQRSRANSNESHPPTAPVEATQPAQLVEVAR